MNHKITTTVSINNETSNPINVGITVSGFNTHPGGWEWEILSLNSVELVVSDKEGVDITEQVFKNSRAKAFLLAQVEDEVDQIADALNEGVDENILIDEERERRIA